MQALKSTIVIMSPLIALMLFFIGLLLPREVATSLEQALGIAMFFTALACFMGLVPDYLDSGYVDTGSPAMLSGIGCLFCSIFSAPLVQWSVNDPAAYTIYAR